jgi:hypothetical protein
LLGNSGWTVSEVAHGTMTFGGKMELHQFSDRAIKIGDVVVEMADKLRHEPAEVAINWLRYKQTIPLLGASQAAQMASNLQALKWELTEEIVRQLDHASAIDYGFLTNSCPLNVISFSAAFVTKLSNIANPVREKQGPVKSTTSIQIASAANRKTVGFFNDESLLSSDLDRHFLLT